MKWKGSPLGLTFAQLEDTPVGPISLMAGDQGLRGVAFTTLNEMKKSQSQTDLAPSLTGMETLAALLVELNAYLSGIQWTFSVDIDWEILAGFQREVLTLTANIPYGQVSTYGAIAKQLGKPGAARAVGMALSRNPIPIVIPCHRVIGSDGALHGYIGGKNVKAFLLALEGHKITNHKVAGR